MRARPSGVKFFVAGAALLWSMAVWGQAVPEAGPPTAADAQTFISVVPVVANTVGVAGVNWRSEVVLRNDSQADAEVVVTMPGAVGQPFILTSVAAGQTLYLGDLVHETFGLPAALGPLVVQTSGRRAVAVISVIRALKPEGGEAATQSIPALLPPVPMHRQLLIGLEVSEAHRTNLGLANVGEESVHFTLGLEVVPGRFVETASFTVPAYTTMQLALQEIFPVLARGAGLRVVAEPSGPNGFAYASVIENATSNGRFVTPAPYTSARPR